MNVSKEMSTIEYEIFVRSIAIEDIRNNSSSVAVPCSFQSLPSSIF